MATTFAALETRLNQAVFNHLSNVTSAIAGVDCTGIFDNGYALGTVGSVGMAGSQPTWTVPTASIPPRVIDWFRYFTEPFDPLDLIVVINEVTYRLVAHEPNGSGMSLLLMELA